MHGNAEGKKRDPVGPQKPNLTKGSRVGTAPAGKMKKQARHKKRTGEREHGFFKHVTGKKVGGLRREWGKWVLQGRPRLRGGQKSGQAPKFGGKSPSSLTKFASQGLVAYQKRAKH